MSRYQAMNPLRRSTFRRQIERNRCRDEAAQRKAARRACWAVRQALMAASTIASAKVILTWLAGMQGLGQ